MARHDHPTSIRLKSESRAYLKREAAAQRRGIMSLVEIILEQWIAWDKNQKKKAR